MLPTLRSRRVLSPWADFATLRREMDELFDSFFGRRAGVTNGEFVWTPVCNVWEDENALYVQAELPGLTKDEISVSVENGVLTISGEKREERREGQKDTFHLYERRYGRFERSFTLPSNVDADHIRARYENGVLELTIPKTEEAKPRRIQIEAAK